MECDRCGGRGVVNIRGCAAECTLLRHVPTCPIEKPVECPACAKERLGEDLPS